MRPAFQLSGTVKDTELYAAADHCNAKMELEDADKNYNHKKHTPVG
jgi:hypothetical protein